MSTTDDDQPIGEGPIDTLAAINRGAVLGILSAADQVLATRQLAERQAAAIELIRQLHVKSPYPRYSFTGGSSCHSCNDVWPCPTIRALDEAGA